MTDKLQSIKQLLESDSALLEMTLKEALDFVEEYNNDSDIKKRVVEVSWQLRQLKKQGRTRENAFNAYHEEMLSMLTTIAASPLSIVPISKSESIVVLKNIGKSYQSHNFTLQQVNLNFSLGHITGIVGANANGKSTLIKIMVGELLPNVGEVIFPSLTHNNKQLPWLELKKHIAYIPQDLPEWHGSLRDNLHIETTLHNISGKENILRVDFILERLGLTEYVDRRWHELSGGYKLRFSLAKALVWKPRFLVLDEPLANLDMASQMIVLQDLKDLVKSERFPLGIVITSQHIHEIEQIADQLIVLEQGQIVYNGKPKAFKADTENYIFEFTCEAEWSEIVDILRGSPLQSIQRQGRYIIVQFSKNEYSTTEFLTLLMKNGVHLTYFRDITHSVKQLFLNI
ncbi:MAG: ABC transporter ATP-binding protein [Saprospiraceae bacterium]|nr:ABC transporter ATP-binding protein [Saprospiraceae bacterium]